MGRSSKIKMTMINMYKIKQLNYDFMGYSLQKGDKYTYHHLRIFARDGGSKTIRNGAVLCGKSSHPYLHLIEWMDKETFDKITEEMIKENEQGFISRRNIKIIDELLTKFEQEHSNDLNVEGKKYIKEIYKKRIMKEE